MNWVDKARKLNKEFIVCVGIDPVMSNIQKLGLNLSDWSKIIIDSTAEYTLSLIHICRCRRRG